MKQLKLPIDHTPHIEHVARQLAKQLQEENGYRSYDHAYKSACHLLNFFREEGEQDDNITS
jgi:hypothetical protein